MTEKTAEVYAHLQVALKDSTLIWQPVHVNHVLQDIINQKIIHRILHALHVTQDIIRARLRQRVLLALRVNIRFQAGQNVNHVLQVTTATERARSLTNMNVKRVHVQTGEHRIVHPVIRVNIVLIKQHHANIYQHVPQENIQVPRENGLIAQIALQDTIAAQEVIPLHKMLAVREHIARADVKLVLTTRRITVLQNPHYQIPV